MDSAIAILMVIVALGSLKVFINIAAIFRERVIEQATDVDRFNESGERSGKLSIIVPFYNEERNLEKCVKSLAEATEGYEGSYEIIFVDDGSSDSSMDIIQEWLVSSTIGNVAKVLSSGRGGINKACSSWVGKSLPCHIGYESSVGDHLLFLDADVELEPGAIHRILAQAVVDNTDFMSVIPKAKCDRWYAWAFYPVSLICQVMAFDFIRKNPDNSFPSASGQMMYFTREGYDEIGGFKALSGNVAQDVRAAKRAQKKGLIQKHILGYDLASVGSEESFWGLINASSKSILVAVENDVLKVLLFPIIMILMTVFPYGFFLKGGIELYLHGAYPFEVLSMSGLLVKASTVFSFITLVIHGITLRRFSPMVKGSNYRLGLYPAGSLIFMLIALHALFVYYSGNRRHWKWKGRKILAEEK